MLKYEMRDNNDHSNLGTLELETNRQIQAERTRLTGLKSVDSLVDVTKWAINRRHNILCHDGTSIIAQVHRSGESAICGRRNCHGVKELYPNTACEFSTVVLGAG